MRPWCDIHLCLCRNCLSTCEAVASTSQKIYDILTKYDAMLFALNAEDDQESHREMTSCHVEIGRLFQDCVSEGISMKQLRSAVSRILERGEFGVPMPPLPPVREEPVLPLPDVEMDESAAVCAAPFKWLFLPVENDVWSVLQAGLPVALFLHMCTPLQVSLVGICAGGHGQGGERLQMFLCYDGDVAIQNTFCELVFQILGASPIAAFAIVAIG